MLIILKKKKEEKKNISTKEHNERFRTSLVVQWLRIRLPMLGTQIQSLVWEDPPCHGATKPMSYNY